MSKLVEFFKSVFYSISRIPSRVAKALDPYADNPLDYREKWERSC